MMSFKRTMIGLLGVLGLGASSAFGAAVLDFSNVGSPALGSITYNPGTQTITASNLGIGTVEALGTAADGTYSMNGILNFTMPNVTYNAGTGLYTAAAGGVFTIDGTAPGVASSANLLTGTFTGGTFTIAGVFVNGTDVKNASMLAFFGIPGNPPFTFTDFNVSITPGGLSGFNAQTGAFTARGKFSTDVANTSVPPVPEPMSVILLGTTMVGIATIIRRRKKGVENLS